MKLQSRFTALMILLAAVVLLAVGCAGKKVDKPSGFLGGHRVYQSMNHDAEFGTHMVWYQPQTALKRYHAFMIPKVKVYLSRKGRERDIDPKDLQKLADTFRVTLIQELGPEYHVTNIPETDTAILRIALTDANPSIAALNAIPQTNFITAAGVGGASFEAEMIDAMTQQPVAAVMDNRYGKRYNYLSGVSKWGHTENVFEEWAQTLKKRLKKAQGKG